MYSDTTKLTKKPKKFSQTRGADLFGVADLMPVQSFVSSHGPSWIGGFPRAVSIPGSTPYNFDNLTGLISHKLVAHLAGSGWIGRSCLLLTEAFGPRVRFVSILTDAPLEIGSSVDKPCGRCHVCVDVCPVAAFTGKEFSPDEGREIRFDAYKCSEYHREHPCGLCVSSCPKGKARRAIGKRLPG